MILQPAVQRLIELFLVLPVDELEKRSVTRDYSYPVESLQYGFYCVIAIKYCNNCNSQFFFQGHFSIPDYIKPKSINHLRLMEEELFNVHSCFMTFKTCPYLRTLSPLIALMIQSGIPHRWEERV